MPRRVGRRYLIDVVMQTPQRFSDAFRAAVEAELPAFAPAMVRARRRAQGQDEPEVADVDHLVASGVPVVTYTTDVPSSLRCGTSASTTTGRGDGRISDEPVAGTGLVGCAHHSVPRLLRRWRQHRHGRRGRTARSALSACLSHTTSTPTTGGCCERGASRWCCTTICVRTRGWRCG